MTLDYAIVIPSIGRESLRSLLTALAKGCGPPPTEVVVVDDGREPGSVAAVAGEFPVRVVCSGGRGPAAARNVGWRATTCPWVCFLDDDVVPHPLWKAAVVADLEAAGAVGRLPPRRSSRSRGRVPAGHPMTSDAPCSWPRRSGSPPTWLTAARC